MKRWRHFLSWGWGRLGRALPIYSGLARIGDNRLTRALSRDSGPATCRLRCGLLARVHRSSIIGRTLYYCGDYDRKISRLCSAPLGPGDVMVDVGAQFGDTALPAALRVGDHGAVHAFEPNPHTAALLRESVQLNGLKNVLVHEVALSDEDGELSMFVPDGAPEGGTLTGRNASKRGSHVPVQARNAASYLREIGAAGCRVLKLDVEGHEGVILRGAIPFLRESPPWVVIFESERRRGPFDDREEVRILRECGYRILEIRKSLFRPRLGSPPSPDRPQGSVYDFIAVHKTAPIAVLESLRLKDRDRGDDGADC